MSKRYLPLVLLCVAGILGAEPKRDRFGDPLPEGAIARLGSLRFRHQMSVHIVGFSLDGKMLATFDGGDAITCWDTASGRQVRRMKVGYISQPRCLRFSSDGKRLIVAERDGAMRIVELDTGREWLKLEPQKLDRRYLDVRGFDITRDDKTAVTLYYGDAVVVWDLAEGKPLHEFKLPNNSNRVSHKPIGLTPDGKHLVVPHTDGSLHLLDVATGKEEFAFEMKSDPAHTDPPNIAISPDGRYLAYGGSYNNPSDVPSTTVTLCDIKTGKRMRELSSKVRIHEWLFTPDSRLLAVIDKEWVRLVDIATGKETKSLRFPQWHNYGLVFSPDGRKLAAATGTGVILWDVEAGKLLHSPVGHSWFIWTIQFFPDGKRLVSHTSGEMIAWDIASSQPLPAHANGKMAQWFAVTADGETVRYVDWIQKPAPLRKGKEKGHNENGLQTDELPRPAGMESRKIERWNLATNRTEPETDFSIPRACDWFEMSPDGRRLVSITLSSPPQVSLREIKGDKPAVAAALPDDSRVQQVIFSPDGRRLLVSTWLGALRVLDSCTGQRVHDLKPDASGRRLNSTPTFSADGRCVAFYDGQVRIREVASGKDRLEISAPNSTGELAFSPDGRFLVSNSRDVNDGSTCVVSTKTGKLLARWWGKQGLPQCAAFSPDCRMLAVGGFDGTILLWNVPEDEQLPAKLSQEEAETFWQALAKDDAAHANFALASLAAAPAQAIPLLKERFRTEWSKQDARRLARLIAELDDEAFKVREQATRELAEAGTDAIAPLRQALGRNPSVEAKRRIEPLLARLEKGGIDPERLRSLRAIEVLERIGTPEAIGVLRELARKSLPRELQEDIEATLARLEKRRVATSEPRP